MFCNNCGTKKVSNKDRFCKKCGCELTTQSTNMNDSISYERAFEQSKLINQMPLNQNSLKQSISILKDTISNNIMLVSLTILAIILVCFVDALNSIPFAYVIFKFAEGIAILLVMMKALLPNYDFKYILENHNKNILTWILMLLASIVIVEATNSILSNIGNSMLNNISYYAQSDFISRFNLFITTVQGISVDIIVTIAIYTIGFKVFNSIINNISISISEAFESLKVNVKSIAIVLLVVEVIGFFNGFLFGTNIILYNIVGIINIFLWISLISVNSLLSLENANNI